MAKILHVDDDAELAARVQEWLVREGHLMEHAESGEDAMQLLNSYVYEAILLDWSLPGISGLDVCRRYRQSGGQAWIIFMTGKGDIKSKEDALEYGADDYLVKPFDIRELSARLKSCLSKKVTRLGTQLKIGNAELMASQREIAIDGQLLRLTTKEAALLECLMRNRGQVFSAKQLFDAVWPSDTESSEGSVRTIMHHLRKKLEAAGAPDLVKTVLGSGYTVDGANSPGIGTN